MNMKPNKDSSLPFPAGRVPATSEEPVLTEPRGARVEDEGPSRTREVADHSDLVRAHVDKHGWQTRVLGQQR